MSLDPGRTVTGQSSIETAIASTRRMIDALDRALEEARNTLADADMDVLDEIDTEDLTVQVKARIGPPETATRRWA